MTPGHITTFSGICIDLNKPVPAMITLIDYEALMKKTEANLDQSEIKIEVSLRRW